MNKQERAAIALIKDYDDNHGRYEYGEDQPQNATNIAKNVESLLDGVGAPRGPQGADAQENLFNLLLGVTKIALESRDEIAALKAKIALLEQQSTKKLSTRESFEKV